MDRTGSHPQTAPLEPPRTVRGAAPQVRLGRTHRNGIAPSIFALVERGVHRHPGIAAGMRGRIVLRFSEEYVPVRMTFGKRVIRVEDGDLKRADLTISGRLPDIVLLTTAPLRMGMPDPMDGRGRAALGRLATGRVRIWGSSGLARQLLELLRIEVPKDTGPGAMRFAGDPDESQAVWIDVLT